MQLFLLFKILTIIWLIYVLSNFQKLANLWIYIMKSKFSINFGKRVRYFRNLARLTQEDLAPLLGLEPGTISYIENGKNNISFAKLPKLCEALKIEPWQLFVFDDLPDVDKINEITKVLESMTDMQLSIVHKLLLDFANLKPESFHKSV